MMAINAKNWQERKNPVVLDKKGGSGESIRVCGGAVEWNPNSCAGESTAFAAIHNASAHNASATKRRLGRNR